VTGNGRKAEEGYIAAVLAEDEGAMPAAAALHLENFSSYTAQDGATLSYERLWQWRKDGRLAEWDLGVSFYGKLARAVNRAGDPERARSVYEEAVRTFPPSEDFYAMVLDYAEFHRKEGETAEAMALLRKELAGAPLPFRTEARFLSARVEWKAGRLSEARKEFLAIAEGSARSGTADRARYLAAWIAEDDGDVAGATELFGKLRRAADDATRQEALFRYAYGLYRLGRYGEAAAAFSAGEKGGFGTVESARHRFWRARAVRAAGKPEEADRILSGLSGDAFAGIYAMFAVAERGGDPFRILAAPPNGETDACGEERDRLWAKVRGAPWGVADAERVRRAERLVFLGLLDYAVVEADRVDRVAARKAIGLADGGAPGVFRYLAGDLKGAIRETSGIPVDPGAPGLVDRIQYPLAPEFLPDCDRRRSGIDPLVLLAIIRQESRFQADALSSAGAVGLMQLMPRTAAKTAQKEKLPKPRKRDLTRPDLNVRLGAAYLSGLLKAYRGDYFRAVAAYNAGEGAVARWWEGSGGDHPTYLERVSYRETRFYMRRVFLNLLQYYRIYRPAMFARYFPIVPTEEPPASGVASTPPPGEPADNVLSTPPTPEDVPYVSPPPAGPGGT
jgi:soluble lytic murein transglycosylase